MGLQSVFFITNMICMAAYLCVAAVEDHKTCMVTRWKHLIGFVPTMVYFTVHALRRLSAVDISFIIIFMMIMLAAGLIGIFGLADGFVMANIILQLGSFFGCAGVMLSCYILVTAGVLFLVWQLVQKTWEIIHSGFSLSFWELLLKNGSGAFVPHIAIAYCTVVVWIGCCVYGS